MNESLRLSCGVTEFPRVSRLYDVTFPDAPVAVGDVTEGAAARIRACVNACQGIPTRILESGTIAAVVEKSGGKRTYGPLTE